MMIDWISATITAPRELSAIYDSGRNLKLSPDGEIIRESRSPLDVYDEDPSSSRHFRVFIPDQRTLYLSGNPVKLLQGHNLFGSDDVNGLYLHAGCFIRKNVGLFPSPESYDSCEFTKPHYSRLDLTRSYRFDTQTEVKEFIRHTAGTARSRHGAAQLFGSETAYFGKNSRRWSLKIYDKHEELMKNTPKFVKGIRKILPCLEDELVEWSNGILRLELCLRGQELKAVNQQIANDISPDWPGIWESYFQRIQFNENATMTTQIPLLLDALKPTQRHVYESWKDGKDLRAIYPKNTFYRHRRSILAALGVDIATPPGQEGHEVRSIALDPSRFDPEPIESRLFTPDDKLKKEYRLV